jgi:hypothetical protein
MGVARCQWRPSVRMRSASVRCTAQAMVAFPGAAADGTELCG